MNKAEFEEYIKNYKEDLGNKFLNYKDEFRAVLDGDLDGLIERHDMDEGDDIYEFIGRLDNHGATIEANFEDKRNYKCFDVRGRLYRDVKFNPQSGFSLNNEYGEYFNNDNAYVVFERSSSCKWFIGQYGQAYISFSAESDKFVLEDLGNDFEYSPLYEYVDSYIQRDFKSGFEDFKLKISDDELSERIKAELRVDSAAEWLLEEARHYDTPVVTFKEFVECLQATDYEADEAVRKILDEGWHNVCDVDGIDFTKEDFLQDINTHIETIQKLKDEHDDWENVMSVFGVDEYNLSNFDEDMVEDELNENFPEQDEPEVKKRNKPKP